MPRFGCGHAAMLCLCLRDCAGLALTLAAAPISSILVDARVYFLQEGTSMKFGPRQDGRELVGDVLRRVHALCRGAEFAD